MMRTSQILTETVQAMTETSQMSGSSQICVNTGSLSDRFIISVKV